MAVVTTKGDLPLASLKQELIDSLPEDKEWEDSDTCVTGNLMFLDIVDVGTLNVHIVYTVDLRSVLDGEVVLRTIQYTLSGTLTLQELGYEGQLTLAASVGTSTDIPVVNGSATVAETLPTYTYVDDGERFKLVDEGASSGAWAYGDRGTDKHYFYSVTTEQLSESYVNNSSDTSVPVSLSKNESYSGTASYHGTGSLVYAANSTLDLDITNSAGSRAEGGNLSTSIAPSEVYDSVRAATSAGGWSLTLNVGS